MHRGLIIAVLLLMIVPIRTNAQSEKMDTTYIDQRMTAITQMLGDARFKHALLLTDSLEETLRQDKDWARFVLLLGQRASAFKGLLMADSAKFILDSALQLSLDKLGDLHKATATIYNDIAVFHSNNGDYLKALEYARKTFEIREKVLAPNHSAIGIALSNLASMYGYLGDFDREIETIKKSLRVKKIAHGENSDPVAIGYNNLAVAYRNKQDYARSLDYMLKVIDIDEQLLPQKHWILAHDYNSIARVYHMADQLQSAADFAKRALEMNTQLFGPDHLLIAKNLFTLAAISSKRSDFQSQLSYLNQCLQIREQNKDNPLEIAEVYEQMAKAYKSLKDFPNAVTYLKAALALRQEVNPAHFLIARNRSAIAEVYLSMNQLDKALEECQLSLVVLDTSYDHREYRNHPNIDLISAKRSLLTTLDLKAKILEKLSQTLNDDPFRWSVDSDLLALKVVESIQKDFRSDISDELLIRQIHPLMERAIAKCAQLASINDKWAVNALQVSEMSRSYRLAKAINKTITDRMSNIPDSLADRERYLYSMIQQDRSKLASSHEPPVRKQLNNRIFKNLIELDSTQAMIDKWFPKYAGLRAEETAFDLQQSRDKLGEDQLIVEYFLGSKALYLFAITKEDLKIYEIRQVEEVKDLVGKLQKSLTDYAFITEQFNEASVLFVESSSSLFNLILGPALKNYTHQNKLIIVPDGMLGLINFETLLTRAPEESGFKLRNLNYLIREKEISLLPSVTALSQMYKLEEVEPAKFGYAGFANASSTPQNNLVRRIESDLNAGSLEGAEEEIRTTSQLLNGHEFLHEHATEGRFKAISGDYQILHLALHGVMNTYPSKSGLVFGTDNVSIEDGLLNVPEVYGLDLNAEMVLLSACNSGVGKVQLGEGVMSLSRAFLFAGSRSVVMSLWPIPDATSATIVHSFTSQLVSGKPKDEALRLAKIEYLEQTKANHEAHPFFWGGLVPYGLMEPIQVADPLPRNVILALLGMLTLIGTAILRSHSRRFNTDGSK